MKLPGAFNLFVPLIATLLAVNASAASKPIALALKLPKKPPYAAPEVPALLAAGPVSLAVDDARKGDNPSIVGVEQEKGHDVYNWTSAQPVAPLVAKMAAGVLAGWSVRVAEGAPLTLKLSMTTFYVTERADTFGSTYFADVHFKATLVDQTGAAIWSGDANGSSKMPGLDGRASEANTAFSIALREALAGMMSSAKLENAAPPVQIMTAPSISTAMSPEKLFSDLTRLKSAGATEDALLEYAQGHKPARALTVEEILQWKNAGLPDAVIKAATQ